MSCWRFSRSPSVRFAPSRSRTTLKIQPVRELNTEAMAVSVDSPWSLGAWAEQYGVQIPVLSDFSKEITNAYGVMHDMGMSERAVVIIDKNGKVAYSHIQENILEIPSLDSIFAELEKIQ